MDRISELNESVDRLNEESRLFRIEISRQTQVIWTAIVAGGIVVIITVFAAFIVSLNNATAIRHNNEKFCPVVTLMIPAPGDPPAQTKRGVLIAKRASQLALDFNCE